MTTAPAAPTTAITNSTETGSNQTTTLTATIGPYTYHGDTQTLSRRIRSAGESNGKFFPNGEYSSKEKGTWHKKLTSQFHVYTFQKYPRSIADNKLI